MGLRNILANSGECPWCGSSAEHGRDKNDLRTCIRCEARFQWKCPNGCPWNSLGYSKFEREYGCDRCGSTWSPARFEELYHYLPGK